LCLQAIKTENNKFINLRIHETHERDKDDKMPRYKHIKARIMKFWKLVWRKWALDSGFKSLNGKILGV
jgi:hypothetical protein